MNKRKANKIAKAKASKEVKIPTVKVVIEHFPGTEYANFRADKRILTEFCSIVWREKPYGDNPKSYETKDLIDRFFEVDGITEVYLHTYEIGIKKYSAFTWDEIIPGVVARIEQLSGCKAETSETYDNK